ncbi:MAG: hypothetical protein AAFQ84_02840, partial [Pseudomonadota bacterium]
HCGENGGRMDYTVALGAWAISIAAPCVICWLAGDVTGASRTRRLYALADEDVDGLSQRNPSAAHYDSEWVPAFRHKANRRRRHASSALAGAADQAKAGPVAVACDAAAARDAFVEEQALDAERRHLQREAFVSMPAVAEVREQAEAIRRSESAFAPTDREAASIDPVTERVLRHYEASVRELQRISGGEPTRDLQRIVWVGANRGLDHDVRSMAGSPRY